MTEAQDIPQYAKVKVATNRFRESDGVTEGTLGYVIEIYDDDAGPAYEVEVMEPDGRTRALIVARAHELELV